MANLDPLLKNGVAEGVASEVNDLESEHWNSRLPIGWAVLAASRLLEFSFLCSENCLNLTCYLLHIINGQSTIPPPCSSLKWVKLKIKTPYCIKYSLNSKYYNNVGLLFLIWPIVEARAEILKRKFLCFLGELKPRKIASEIIWPSIILSYYPYLS